MGIPLSTPVAFVSAADFPWLVEEAAHAMFSRWLQEGLFRCMHRKFRIDKLSACVFARLASELQLVGADLRNLNRGTRKARERLSRLFCRIPT